jgi:hypothetical protein
MKERIDCMRMTLLESDKHRRNELDRVYDIAVKWYLSLSPEAREYIASKIIGKKSVTNQFENNNFTIGTKALLFLEWQRTTKGEE